MKVEELYKLFLTAEGICTDTRNIISGSIFFALKGDNFNGNEFASTAIEQGCIAAVVDEPTCTGENIYLVEDVLFALQKLALHHRRKFDIPIIGITGSNGKTTTKELIGAVLEKKYNLLYTLGNLNNHLGVPFTLLRLNKSHEMAIIEMGANKPGDIKELSEIAEPTHGIITNIGAAHIEGFGSIEGVVKTKTELYRNIAENKGELFYNADDEVLAKNLPGGIKSTTYSINAPATIQGKVRSLNPYLNFDWFKSGMEKQEVNTQLVGAYNLQNFLAAICIGDYFDVSEIDINTALAEYVPSNHRSQITKTTKNTLVVDCYNANATSMKAAISSFNEMPNENKWLILGSMKELGNISELEHKNVVNQASSTDCKTVFVGPEFKGMSVGNWYNSAQDLIESKLLSEIDNALILLKASRGIGLEKLIPEL